MGYKLNGIPLENYGLFPGKAPGSNLALEGFMDMPKRLGKTFHDWLDDEGIEPYVAPDEMFFGGRTMDFHAYIIADNQQDAVLKLRDLYNDFGRQSELMELDTDWGKFQIYLRQKVDVQYLGDGTAKVKMVFEQVEVDIPNLELPQDRTIRQYHIDFIPFSAFSAFIERTEGQYDRPALKQANFTVYNKSGYHLTKIGQSKVGLTIWFHESTWQALRDNLGRFYKLLAAAGTRTINIDDTEREGFVTDGFKVTRVKVSEGLAMAQVKLTLMLAFDGKPVVNEYLVDEQIDGIQTETGKFIVIEKAEVIELVDDRGRGIGTETLTPITV